MHKPIVSSTTPFNAVWSGLHNTTLNPVLLIAKEGSGFRAMNASEFGASGTVNNISVGSIGVTGRTALAADVLSYNGYNLIPVAMASGSVSAAISAPVGITGSTGLSLDVVAISGFNSIPVFISSGNISSTSSNPVTMVGITGFLSGFQLPISGNVVVTNPTRSLGITGFFGGATFVAGLSGQNGSVLDVVNVSGYNAIPVYIVSGQSAGGGTSTNTIVQIGVTGGNGNAVDVINISGYKSIPVFISSGSFSSTTANPVYQIGLTGTTGLGLQVINASGYNSIPVILASGVVNATISNAVSKVGISGSEGASVAMITGVGLPTSIPVAIVSGSVGITGTYSATISNPLSQFAITGTNTLPLDVYSVSGFNAIPVIFASGKFPGGGSSSSFQQIGITGSNAVAADVFNVSGFNAIPVIIASGGLGSSSSSSQPQVGISGFVSGFMLPVSGAVMIKSSANVTLSITPYNNVNAMPVVVLSGAQPTPPSMQGAYAITVTGSNFSNYASVVPNVDGYLSMSFETASTNTGPIWYSFSGGATTGNAWELRGDRTFSMLSTTGIFFGSKNTQTVMVHYQKY